MCDSGFLEAEDLYGGMGVGKNCGPCNLIFTIKSRARGLKWGTKGPHMCDSACGRHMRRGGYRYQWSQQPSAFNHP